MLSKALALNCLLGLTCATETADSAQKNIQSTSAEQVF